MIDRDFEQVSEQHMKSTTKPEGPAQEPQCTCAIERDMYGDIYEPCAFCQANYIPATPAPSQPAGAREWAEQIVGDVFPSMDAKNALRYVEQVEQRLVAFLAQQTAAKDAEIGRLERDLAQSIATGNENGEKAEYWCNTVVAAERERDSLREHSDMLISALDRWMANNDDEQAWDQMIAAQEELLKARKDGQQ